MPSLRQRGNQSASPALVACVREVAKFVTASLGAFLDVEA